MNVGLEEGVGEGVQIPVYHVAGVVDTFLHIRVFQF